MTDMARQYGDLAQLHAPGQSILFCFHPDLIRELLLVHAPMHDRSVVMQKASLLLGSGLLSSEDPHHLRQRRLTQPAFHRDRIAVYGAEIGNQAQELVENWHTGETRNLYDDMQSLTLRVISKIMFSNATGADCQRIAASVGTFNSFLPLVFLPGSRLLYNLPIPAMTRIRRDQHELDVLLYRFIREQRERGEDTGDMLSMLLASRDGGEGMTDVQARDECVTILLAGNETTANGLSFALWLLARHPELQEQLRAEAQAVLGSRNATASDHSALPFARACFAEAMRLYPPVWAITRTAAQSYEWRGFTVPKGAILTAPQWVVHRDLRFWDEPDAFRPARFLDAAAQKSRHPFVYYPFAVGIGSRQCIGEGLAWMEGTLILATIARSWRFEALSSAPMRLSPEITLRPADGVVVRLHKN